MAGLTNRLIPKIPFNLPFFIFDIDNKQLITTPIIPSDIADSKDVFLVETQIPGLSYSPIQSAGMGNRKVSFSLQVINRDKIFGNLHLIKQFDALRNERFDIVKVFQKTSQFNPNPKVLFKWGIGSVPLIWYVKKCNMRHIQHWTTALADPTYTVMDIELWLDEAHPITKAETMFRGLSALAGQTEGLLQVSKIQGANATGKSIGRPY